MKTDTVVRRFATRLHSLRMERSLSQAALASRAQIHPHFISAMERCTQVPTLLTLEKLARGLKVDLKALVDFPESKTKKEDRAREELELVQQRLESCSLEELRRIRKAIDALVE